MQRLDDLFFPVTPPRQHGHLERDNGHRIYYEVSGAEDGIPVLLCHGGPGGSNGPGFRRYLDAERFCIVQFDQRGCGQSERQGRLQDNSLQHTITDMEALREHLSLDAWIVSGGSWGATVALAYGEAYPERCLGLQLVSLWLCRQRDMEWWFHGVRAIFPELWQAFAEAVPAAERDDLRTAYCERILGDDQTIADRFATQLFLYEEGFMHFDAPLVPSDPARGKHYGRIFAHYARHDFFLEEGQLLRDAQRLVNVPVSIITGRYDCCTVPENAFALAQVLPHANLEIVAGAGHYPSELPMARAIVQASNALSNSIADFDA